MDENADCEVDNDGCSMKAKKMDAGAEMTIKRKVEANAITWRKKRRKSGQNHAQGGHHRCGLGSKGSHREEEYFNEQTSASIPSACPHNESEDSLTSNSRVSWLRDELGRSRAATRWCWKQARTRYSVDEWLSEKRLAKQ